MARKGSTWGYVITHRPDDCEGRPCAVHHSSDHHMRDWPKVVRVDMGGLVERTCPHGIGHPDPDSVAYYVGTKGDEYASALSVHSCDGCCRP